jgi:hypothetical protein
MIRSALIASVLALALVFGCAGCAGVVVHQGNVYGMAAGQSKLGIQERGPVQVCQTVPGSQTPAEGHNLRIGSQGRRLIYSSNPASYGAQVQCQTIGASRTIMVEGGSISNVLAWLAAMIFTGGVTDALGGLIP